MQEVRSGAVTHNRRVARAGGLCKIGGWYLLWGWMREHKPLVWVLLRAVILATYGVVAALQLMLEFRQVYAAYSAVAHPLTIYGIRARWKAYYKTPS
jgi:drug/metabolite transporter superfamily protein YnfA